MNSFRTKPFADKDVIKRVAEMLMQINETTTTLEVKKLLRLEGFIAYQKNVSDAMQQLANHSNWDFTCNGIYRTYFFKVNMDYTIAPNLPSFGYN